MNRKTLFIAVAGLLVLVFVIAVLLNQKQKSGQPDSMAGNPALERQGAPSKGPKDAKVTIVEFFDPACGTCREFAPFVTKLMEQYPGKVKVVMRYAPLHAGSDQVVKMLEAAHIQGKFWPAVELLFGSQNRWVVEHAAQPMRARALLESLELDQQQLSNDMNRPEVVQAVQQDVNDGQLLKVQATPEFFVNGRPLPNFGYDPLSNLVKEAVDEAY